MRILHTADWHLGQSFYGYRRYDEHEAYFSWLIDQAQGRSADALLIAGDLFDLANPSAEALSQYYRFVHRFRSDCPRCRIYIIAGNHDSPQRLEAPRDLLAHHHTYVVGRYPVESTKDKDLEALVDASLWPLHQIGVSEPEAYLLCIPYLGFGRVFPSADYTEQIPEFIKELAQIARERIGHLPLLGMAHLFAGAAILSQEDERERIIGLSEQISVEPFAHLFDYIALGHLHRVQGVGMYTHIRYAGSPLPMSFAEHGSSHGATLVEIGPEGLETIESLVFADAAHLIRLPSPGNESIEALEQELQSLPDNPQDRFAPFLEIHVRPQDNTPSLADRLRTLISGKPYRLTRITSRLLSARLSLGADDILSSTVQMAELSLPTPIDLASQYYQSKYGEVMPQEMYQELMEAIAEINIEKTDE